MWTNDEHLLLINLETRTHDGIGFIFHTGNLELCLICIKTVLIGQIQLFLQNKRKHLCFVVCR